MNSTGRRSTATEGFGMSYRDPAAIERALRSRVWAVVGLTSHEYRAAYNVAAFLQANGMRIVPVNPLAEPVLGETGYAHLSDIEFPIDVVDIFRRADKAGQHVDEAIAIGARCVWLQLGVIDEQAAKRAQDAGLDVVMDACPKIEWPRYGARRSQAPSN
jgi:predicted CoA-binding protein